MSKALLGEQLDGPQHEAKPAASLYVLLERVGNRGSRAVRITVKAYGRGEEPEIAGAKNPPAYGAWNVQIVTTGTGEALPGPVTCVLSPEKRVL